MTTIKQFAKIVYDIQKTDRWVFIGCDGEMGEGKSCFTSQLAKEIAKLHKFPFSYKNNMTYLRSELNNWIDGDAEGKNRKPEYSIILADELISMFFKRNWYDASQIDGIELLNKCRDRHLCVLGNIPNFWDLDSAIYPIVTFWVHINARGVAWVFQKDKNPFTTDKWNRKFNEKLMQRNKSPFKAKGFVCQILFDDWTPEDKKDYYEVRNAKRISSEGQRERGKSPVIRKQRNLAIRYIYHNCKGMTCLKIKEILANTIAKGTIQDIISRRKGAK